MPDSRKDYMYLRLSKEDGDVEEGTVEESYSIASQRTCILQYAAGMPDFSEGLEEIIDDGYSGTNLSRPGIQHLLSLVKRGLVRTIIVRDLSRFARNYLEAGHYLEFILPSYDVRFISINDHYDSKAYGESTGGLELAIHNLINQMYSYDISKKIKSAVDMKKRAGEYVYGTAPYGYKKGEQRNTIVLDLEVAPIVKTIFMWAADGKTITQIAQKLNEERITTPSVYLAPVRGKYKTRSFWTYESVRNILRNRIYTGDTVPFKSHVIRVGSDRVKQIPEELQEIIPCTHEPIVSRELYYQAVKVIKSNQKTKKNNDGYLFTSYLICGCCGNRLAKGKRSNKHWRCSTSRYVADIECGKVKIRDDDLKSVVLRAVQNLCLLADAKLEYANSKQSVMKSKVEVISREIKLLRNQMTRLQNKRMEAYERYVLTEITDTEFADMKRGISEQIESLLMDLQSKEQELSIAQNENNEQVIVTTQMKRISQYHNINELTPELLKELVQKIVVMPGNAIEIIWNFSDVVGEMIGDVTKLDLKAVI